MREADIRRDERKRLSKLITDNTEQLAEYATDAAAAIRLVALLIGLDSGPHQTDKP